MYVDFEKLPDYARVWVYQANRSLTDSEVKIIQEALQTSLDQWAAHGQPLLASVQVISNRFVVVAVDEGYTLPSGCSIDSSVRTIQNIGQLIDDGNGAVDFFDRSVAVQLVDGSAGTFALPVIKSAVSDGLITPETIVFNTLVNTKETFQKDWLIRAADSWLKRYFKTTSVLE